MLTYKDLHKVFPEDLHVARPLIHMLQKRNETVQARDLALTMARRMLASGRGTHALGFLAICEQLEHPEKDEINALLNMARITGSGPVEVDSDRSHSFALIDQLSDAEAMDFLQQGRLIQAKSGTDIVRQGDISRTFYLILEGEVQVHIVMDDGHDEPLSTLRAGHFFGEFACVYNLPRSAMVTAREDSLLLEFSDLSISQLMQRFPMAGEYLMRTVQARMIHAMTHSHPAFAELPEADRRWVAEESRLREFGDNQVIMDKQHHPDSCCIILFGKAEARRTQGDTAIDCTLNTGDMFGDVSRYIQLPPETEVRASDHTLICCMPGEIFQSFMNAYASFEQWVEPHGESHHKKLTIPLEEWDMS
ncbi:MAG: cyclic nucleotide-binding domain-containing protein [Mariprofundaceae bacterium]